MSQQAQLGEIVAFGGAAAPTNFLLCDGAAVSRVTYKKLFDFIGTTFGAGNGSTTFNLPDMTGRMMVGYKSGSANFGTLGSQQGANTINIAHSHTQNAHTHAIAGNTSGPNTSAAGTNTAVVQPTTTHTHPFSLTTSAASNTGSNSLLSATQSINSPFVVTNFVIRYKVAPNEPFIFFAFIH